MQANDILKFTTLIATIGELYGKTISVELTEIYWHLLQRFELEDISLAFEAHISNPDGGQFFPKPADIVRFIEGSGEARALQAWAKVEKAMRQVGRYCSIAFDDSLIHAVLEDMGGWIKLCSITLGEMPFCANEFQKRYMGFVLKKPTRYPKYLCGITERENTKNGYAVSTLLLVGNPKKTEEVIADGGGVPLVINEVQSLQQLIQKLACIPEKNDDK
jgi:hypothetical protein